MDTIGENHVNGIVQFHIHRELDVNNKDILEKLTKQKRKLDSVLGKNV